MGRGGRVDALHSLLKRVRKYTLLSRAGWITRRFWPVDLLPLPVGVRVDPSIRISSSLLPLFPLLFLRSLFLSLSSLLSLSPFLSLSSLSPLYASLSSSLLPLFLFFLSSLHSSLSVFFLSPLFPLSTHLSLPPRSSPLFPLSPHLSLPPLSPWRTGPLM